MIADRIDFISEYCDRWCQRCAFTNRCSAGKASGQLRAAVVVDAIARLRHVAMLEFPDAMRFKRPGVDDVAAGDDARIC